MYAKDLSQPKKKFFNKTDEDARANYLNDPNAFIDCFNGTDDAYENVDDCNPSTKRKILIVFDDMIADIYFRPQLKNYLLDAELLIFHLQLLLNLVFLCQKKSD